MFEPMAEQNIEAKLKKLLKQENIQLWNPPYTSEISEPGQPHMQELAERYAPSVCSSLSEVGAALESIRAQAVMKGKGNKTFRETSMATLELLLPRGGRKDLKKKNYMETKLDIRAQEIMDRIGEEYGLKHVKLILNGKTLSPDQRLDKQRVGNNSKVMVLTVSETERKQQIMEEEKKKNQNESVQRTQKGFQILSERDDSEDPGVKPSLEIANQKGNPLKIPYAESKALIIAMGFHERGRSLMKRKQYDDSLCHLLQADSQFEKCGSALLRTVDNYAVLQLDIVWCYQALEALCCLDDGKMRLQRAEDCFLRCYGEQQERLLMIKGNTGREEVLFVRLYLLQSLLSYIEGNDTQARLKLDKVEVLYSRLCLDSEKMTQLMSLGFTETEARLGLRACQGDLQEAAIHISNSRQEHEELNERERKKRRRRKEAITSLRELGYSQRDAASALHQADGDVDRAYGILVDSSQVTNNNTEEAVDPGKLEQLLYLGFGREVSETALRLAGGDVQLAVQLVLDNNGSLFTSPPSSSPPSEAPSCSSDTSAEDSKLVNEVLEDISHHEEDYLDVTLEEESVLIATMKAYLSQGPAHTV